MARITKRIVSAVLIALAVGLVWLYFTNSGLEFLWGIAVRKDYRMLRYYVLRRALARDAHSHQIAEELRNFSFDTLKEAEDCLDADIALTKDQFAYRLRGDIFLYRHQYAKAAQDYEAALAAHKLPPRMMDFCPSCVEQRLQKCRRLLTLEALAAGATNQASPIRSSELPPAGSPDSRSP